jgi:hypothetical protein
MAKAIVTDELWELIEFRTRARGAEGDRHRRVEGFLGAPKAYSPNLVEGVFSKYGLTLWRISLTPLRTVSRLRFGYVSSKTLKASPSLPHSPP